MSTTVQFKTGIISNKDSPEELTEVEEANPAEDDSESEFESVDEVQDLEIQLEHNLAALF